MGEEYIVSINPATKEEVGKVVAYTADDVRGAVKRAREAVPGWAALLPEERADFLMNISGELKKRFNDITRLITLEVGKPLVESERELDKAMVCLEYFARNTQGLMASETVEGPGITPRPFALLCIH